jgi:apolipoprotein N-acyltransferase
LVPLIQIASVTGVYGVSFIVVWSSLCLLLAVVALLKRPTVRYAWLAEIILPLGSVLALFAFGMAQIRKSPEASNARTIRVTFVQPSIPQELIWDDTQDAARFRELIQLTKEALTNKTDLLLWPEAAVPGLLRFNEETVDALTALARSNHVWMIVGADDAELKKHPAYKNDADYYNSSFLINPEGLFMSRYRKRNLVIFGEYVPLVKWLPFIKYFTPIQGGFTPGDHAVPFRIPELGIKTSVLICFEDVFPHLAREYAADDIDFLVNLTNNGWFGEGSAQWQHGMSGLFRAVENGLPLLRCCNNGLTCWVDEHGRIRQIFHDRKGTIYGAGVMCAEIPVRGGRREPTFYNRHGDWFGWACVGLTLIKLGGRVMRRKQVAKSGIEVSAP